jgi:acetyltransferase-like isoleucine patch superfamily enzyme
VSLTLENNIKFPNVYIGAKTRIEHYCIVGLQPEGMETDRTTKIGINSIIRSHTVIYSGNIIGNYFRTGHHVTIREDNRIGSNVSIGTGSCIEHHILIGDNVRIHSQVFIPEYSVLENYVWIGPNVVFTNAKYPLSRGVKERLKGPIIKSRVKIGANATILPGIEIGKNSLIGAGSVVTNNVPPNTVVAGNPARIIRPITEIEVYD